MADGETGESETKSIPNEEESTSTVKPAIELTVDEQISHTINKKYDK